MTETEPPGLLENSDSTDDLELINHACSSEVVTALSYLLATLTKGLQPKFQPTSELAIGPPLASSDQLLTENGFNIKTMGV